MKNIAIIPKPSKIEILDGECNIDKVDKIKNESLKEEAYILEINKDSIHIEASSDSGFFYGEKTLQQISFQYKDNLPCLKIIDEPEYSYRSFHIDTSRHFFKIEELKETIDAAAAFKLNHFHWHFSDDQGYRIESKTFPLLQEISAKRKGDHFGAYSSDEEEHFYYTQDEVKEIVKYCKERFIEIVPEVDMPGHVMAILGAYPNLSCLGNKVEVETRPGIFTDILCPGKEETFEFIFKLLDELCELFPGRFFHIGGDETPKTRWSECSHCKKRMEDEGLKDLRQLQGYLMNRVAAYLNKKGKTAIAWNEAALGDNLDTDIILQLWNDDPKDPSLKMSGYKDENGKLTSENQGIGSRFIRKGGQIINSNMISSYCDYPHAYISLKKVYEGDIIPQQCEDLKDSIKDHILGGESLCWSEYIRTIEELEEHVWPRYVAKAEALWSTKGTYKNFVSRLKILYPYLKTYVPYSSSPTQSLFASIKEMMKFGKNFNTKTIKGFADAQKEV